MAERPHANQIKIGPVISHIAVVPPYEKPKKTTPAPIKTLEQLPVSPSYTRDTSSHIINIQPSLMLKPPTIISTTTTATPARGIHSETTAQGWKEWLDTWFALKLQQGTSQAAKEWSLWQKRHPNGWVHGASDSFGTYNEIWTTVVNGGGYVYWWDKLSGAVINDEPQSADEVKINLDSLKVIRLSELDALRGRLQLMSTKAANRARDALEMIRRDFLQDNDPEYTGQAKMAKLERLQGTFSRMESYLQYQKVAEDYRKLDPSAPMVFINVDGTCWLNSILQVILALPNIRDLVATILDERLQKALTRLLDERDRNEPVAFLWDVLHALGNQLKYCYGHDSAEGLRTFMKMIPGLKSSSVVHYSKDGSIPPQNDVYRYIFVTRDLSVLGAENTLNLPLSREVNIGGKSEQYAMIAGIKGYPGHGVPQVLVDGQWYDLDDHRITKLQNNRVTDRYTSLVVYQLL